MTIGIFYGSSMGKTAEVAAQIAEALGVDSANVHNVANAQPEKAAAYDALILGSSTWGDGDLQDDWPAFLAGLTKQNLSGKKVAIFGCGDSGGYAATFCNAVAALYDALSATGATLVGAYVPQGYDVTDSAICKDGKFVGLALDDCYEFKNAKRIKVWAEQLKTELA